MELEPRTTAPAHATGAVEFVALEDVSDDATFRLRDEGDVGPLAASMGRLGQLVPIELRPMTPARTEGIHSPLPQAEPGGEGQGEGASRPRWQIVSGFRRVAAARLLGRERVLARVHATLEDDDAWSLALAQALVTEPLLASELAALGERLEAERLAPWAGELVPDAVARAPVDPKLRERFSEFLERAAQAEAEAAKGEGGAVEVTPEELADDLARRMFEVNEDLALAWSSWAELPREGRRMIVAQARYVAELLELIDRQAEGGER